VAGHAGLFAAARSVAALGQAWLEGAAIFDIDPALAADAKRQHAETNGARRGLGFALRALENAAAGDKLSLDTFGHTGFTGTSLWIDPRADLVIACLTNSVYPGRLRPGTLEFRRAAHDAIYQAVV
jgi:CubicO group peptidase (beta-lactamase class C family)